MKKIQTYHVLSAVITLGFIFVGFLFPLCSSRLIESIKDLFEAVLGFFNFVVSGGKNVDNTVGVTSTSNVFLTPVLDLGRTWSAIRENCARFWSTFFSEDNFLYYRTSVGEFMLRLMQALLVGLPLFLCVYLLFSIIFNRHKIADNKDTFFLHLFKGLSAFIYRPIKKLCIDYRAYLKDWTMWCKIWLLMFFYYFNGFSILIEFVAFYFYLAYSQNYANIPIQIYKLLCDLRTVVEVVPLFLWVFIFVRFVSKKAYKRGMNNLRHNEARNRGYIEERGISTIINGKPGAGKTWLATDQALSEEVRLRDMAYEVILESDMKFPFFPWINLERALKAAFGKHEIFSVPSCRRWLSEKYKSYRRRRCPKRIWDYDIYRYPTKYNSELEIEDIWQVIDDYACAFLVYTVQSSLLVSNYSIRTDNVLMDMGAFPVWNADFFDRDPRLMDSCSRHAHILDWDMLRLGKTMIKNNPNRFAFGFGVYVITEINQERKNSKTLSEVKIRDEECNQKNDLFVVLERLSRHACVIAHRPFVKFIADLQRVGDLSLDILELGEIVDIVDVGHFVPVLPFWSPFFIFDTIANLFLNFFNKIYKKYRICRTDNTATMHLLKKIVYSVNNILVRKHNLYDTRVLKLAIQSGNINQEPLERKYYESKKKGLSRRFSTDAHAGIFEDRAKYNEVGINDLVEYLTHRAFDEELLLQNSFLQAELRKV